LFFDPADFDREDSREDNSAIIKIRDVRNSLFDLEGAVSAALRLD